ncbi:hypothetical protein FGF66_07100 [Chlorobaculum thiosulfatiphilum]|uniref:Uncharacterized protein n=1 Tax=Chlorobaculum thiosulfatiphilum TaxID=115852 RepID=A0A5C4S642_CHLTI|nr:hypothetical protein [Chlorobaculum thiosulfatiphilum]NTV82559.1 hypothetical protein [Chlorobaculum sp.]TNJ38886.1 hypothetical protein FGF66_07100 [Chlorobaculum thiosulfatiphilum]
MAMKKDILERYDRLDDGRVVIDVYASKVEELYEDFDKQAPFHRKDLDEELAAYLIDCVREIGRVDFIIRITLDSIPSGEFQERIRSSLRQFFIYQQELITASTRRQLRKSLLFLFGGMVLLFLSLRFGGGMTSVSARLVYERVLVEGVTIAAWVSMWESLTILMFSYWPARQRIRLNSRIAGAEVRFQSHLEVGR